MLFFLPEVLNNEVDALQTSGKALNLKGYKQQNAASAQVGIQDTAKASAVADQSLQLTSSQLRNDFTALYVVGNQNQVCTTGLGAVEHFFHNVMSHC
jgi:hypothetical protein